MGQSDETRYAFKETRGSKSEEVGLKIMRAKRA